jgi:hypothetical protein
MSRGHSQAGQCSKDQSNSRQSIVAQDPAARSEIVKLIATDQDNQSQFRDSSPNS